MPTGRRCDDRRIRERRLIAFALAAGAIALGAFSIAVARAGPAYSFAGRSSAAAALELVGGLALVAAGLAAHRRRPESHFGLLLAAAGLAWFLLEWNNPDAGSAFVFTAGLVLFAAAAPIVAHAALAFPEGRIERRSERTAIATAYIGAVIALGLLPTLVFDPRASRCYACPHNLLLAAGDSHLYDKFAFSRLTDDNLQSVEARLDLTGRRPRR